MPLRASSASGYWACGTVSEDAPGECHARMTET